jgi:hypothetical protein
MMIPIPTATEIHHNTFARKIDVLIGPSFLFLCGTLNE